MSKRTLANDIDDIKFVVDRKTGKRKMSFIGKIITIIAWGIVGMFIMAILFSRSGYLYGVL